MLKKIQQIQAHVEMLMRRKSLIFINGVPSPREGKVGDFRVNELTGDIYGPKTMNSWGLPTGNIFGVAGDVSEILILDQTQPTNINDAFQLGTHTKYIDNGNISNTIETIVLKEGFAYRLFANFARISMTQDSREGVSMFRDITSSVDLGIAAYASSRTNLNPWIDSTVQATCHVKALVDTTISLVTKKNIGTVSYIDNAGSPAGVITITNIGKLT